MHRMLVPYFVVMLVAYAVGYPAAVFVVLRRARNTKVPPRPAPSIPLCSTADLLCSVVFCLSCPDLFYCIPFLSVLFCSVLLCCGLVCFEMS